MTSRAATPPVAASSLPTQAGWRCGRCDQPNSGAAMKCTGCSAPRTNIPVAGTGATQQSRSSATGAGGVARNPLAPSPVTITNDPFGGMQKRFSSAPAPPPPQDPRQQLSAILKAIRDERKAWTVIELKVHTNINIMEHPQLLETLKLKANWNDTTGTLEYKAKFQGIRHRADLELFLRQPPYKFGILFEAIDDVYIGVKEDVKNMAKEGVIYLIDNPETKKACIYPRVRLRLEVEIDPQLQQLWHRVTMPITDGQLEEKLIKSGHMKKQELKGPVATVKQKAAKSHKKRRMGNMTNSHLVGRGLGEWIDNMAKPTR